MRALKLCKYHLARHARKIMIYALIVLILSLGSMLIAINYSQGNFIDPADFTSSSSFSILVTVFALWLVNRERKFMVSLSVTRRELLLGSLYFLIALAALMTAAQYLVDVIGRGVMWIAGTTPRGGWNARFIAGHSPTAGWSVELLFTGGNPRWAEVLLSNFSAMVSDAGIYTLIGYLFLRWWKVILIMLASGIVLLIVLATQIRFFQQLNELANFLTWFVQWLVETAIPAIIDFVYNSSLWLVVSRNAAICAACFALSYPVMRKMPVVK